MFMMLSKIICLLSVWLCVVFLNFYKVLHLIDWMLPQTQTSHILNMNINNIIMHIYFPINLLPPPNLPKHRQLTLSPFNMF